MALTAAISLIVPVGPGENLWQGMLPAFKALPSSVEIIMVATEVMDRAAAELVVAFDLKSRIRWEISPEVGRAKQMNYGATLAKNPFLWFVHADSRFTYRSFAGLIESIGRQPDALHYFRLSYYDGPLLVAANELGAWVRSRLLRLPFGDQGFCLSRRLFQSLGCFDESSPYGEDHLLVWEALRQHVPIRYCGEKLLTSARKYRDAGWLRTTLLHNVLTVKQALPEGARYCRQRLGLAP